jgi:zinc protease
MMKKQQIIFSIVLFTAFSLLFMGNTYLHAQKSPKDTFDFPKLNKIETPKIKAVTLKNGLKLYLVEDHQYPTINMRALISTGTAYEPIEKAGLASLTASALRTGGTKKMKGDEIDKILETMAATVETYASDDYGYVYVSMLKDTVDKVLPIFADILKDPVFSEDKIMLAKMQAKTSISRRNDEPFQIVFREFQKLIYGVNSPYARQSEYATIDAITRDDITAFYGKYFHPNNMIMAVWGDFDTGKMHKKLEQVFGSWKSVPLEIPPLPKVNYEFDYTVNYVPKKDINQSFILIGHIGGMLNNPDQPALNVMNSILSTDRMFKKIRTDEGLSYAVWGNYGADYKKPGYFSAGAQTKSESTVKAIKLMIGEMKRMTEEEVTDEELKRAKDEYLNSYVFKFETKSQIISRMMLYAFYGYPLDFSEKVKAGVENVTRADVLRVAQKYLKPDKVRILVVGNGEAFGEPLSVLGNVNTIDITIPSPKEK